MKHTILSLLITCSLSWAWSQEVTPETKLEIMGITLFEPGTPVANYVKVVRTGNLLFTAGHGPGRADGSLIQGKLGKDLTIEEGYEAARITGIALLSTLKAEIGDLSRVK